jgi:uncharacterized membrane protein YeaQ/YmgE (transglycosylase-associated protein family)
MMHRILTTFVVAFWVIFALIVTLIGSVVVLALWRLIVLLWNW